MFSWDLLPILWLALAIGLGVAELFTVQLVAIWFAVGAVVSIIPAMLGQSIWVQLAVFCVVSILMLIFTRPVVKKKLHTKIVHTNADSNIGKVATVIMDITPTTSTGRVHLGGLDWAARSEHPELIAVGEQVVVKQIEGVTLIVEPA